MAWQDAADKYINEPWVEVTINFDDGDDTRYYSFGWIRESSGKDFKGKLLDISSARSSVGDIQRTWERNRITLTFDDSDYGFRTLETTLDQRYKGTEVIIEIGIFEGTTRRTLKIFDCVIYDWARLDNLRFQIICEEIKDEFDNAYPDMTITRTDWPNADETAIGLPIAIIFGEISASGDTDDGAFGYPSLTNGSGLPMVDTTPGSEKHLVGISFFNESMTGDCPRVYSDGVLKTPGVGNDYTLTDEVIDGYHVLVIEWDNYSPTILNKISCDILARQDGPVFSITNFLNFYVGVSGVNFSVASFNAANTIEDGRGYLMDGAMFEQKSLREWLDDWRDEFELDIYWDKSGEICYRYLSYITGVSANHYKDYLHVLSNFESDPQVADIMNRLLYGLKYHYSKTYFRDYETIQDIDSQTKYGGIFRDTKLFYFIRDAAMAADIGYRKLLRRKDPPLFDTILFPLKTYSDDLTEVIKLTHFLGDGTSGYNTKRFQIRSVDYDLNRFTNLMLLEACDSFIAYACVLGDDTGLPATWTNADEDEREYCYLCDSTTKEFSDGEPGKRLID